MKKFEDIDISYAEMYERLNKKNEEFEKVLKKLKGADELSCYNLISIDDLSLDDIKLIFRLAWPFKERFMDRETKKIPLLKGKTVINFFFETSTRTKMSFEIAGKQLSADTINISGSGSSMSKKGETLKDTAATINDMKADAVIMRHDKSGAPYIITKELKCPVLNAGDGCNEHPSQALLDAFTICEKLGTIKKKTILIVGDVTHSRVAGSLIRIIKKMKGNVRIAAPPTFLPSGIAEEFDLEVYYDLDEALKDVDVIYALRVQTERQAAGDIPTIREYSKNFAITEDRVKKAKNGAIVMHPGPVIREVDLKSEVMDAPYCVVDDQVNNGYAIRLALLYLMVRKDEKFADRLEQNKVQENQNTSNSISSEVQ